MVTTFSGGSRRNLRISCLLVSETATILVARRAERRTKTCQKMSLLVGKYSG
jgi:hypothetical protein